MFGVSTNNSDLGVKIFAPLFFCAALALLKKIWFAPYLLFFTVSLTSAIGITKSLTGTFSESLSPFIFGLSFYTASLAFLFKTQKGRRINTANIVLKASNPLLLVTGPIVLSIRNISNFAFKKRVSVFTPYIIVGIFYYQILSVPLLFFIPLISATDIISVLCFVVIFEVFVYTNFCGLSLLIYGCSGLLGFKVPMNFRQPFSASNLVEFWKGWHISLSRVLKTLFYEPLRKRFSRTIALFAVFVASAMWHGITINFFLWGLFHASMFTITVFLLKREYSKIPGVLMIFTVLFGRFLFSESNIDQLLEKLSFQFIDFKALHYVYGAPNTSKIALVISLFLIIIESLLRKHNFVGRRTYKHLRIPISLALILTLTILLSSNTLQGYAVYGQR